MYKVFMNDKPIILTDSPQNEKGFKVYDFESVVLDEILYKLKKDKINGVVLFCRDLNNCWKEFTKHFKVVKAAGGLVLNQQQEFLFIYRGQKWDLPKGRIEENESIETTAIREVEEECGVQNLSLDRFLLTTYHLFYQNKQKRLKVTDWFLMNTNYQGKLTPQIEEGITIAEFKNKSNTKEALKNTYANIHLVFEAYDA
ncbi:NUDIX domain-containing protein [Pseudotenacibaculum sp. MALMAid0570]|uniref:NUDIX hydrolase n=1 Tax=Pseudotenacibaculum sp. MALMAid0570 TaxID=3143938 RepID=UPI0032E0353A